MKQGRFITSVLAAGLGLLIVCDLLMVCDLARAQQPPAVESGNLEVPEVEISGTEIPVAGTPADPTPANQTPTVEVEPVDPVTALTEGNQYFFEGQMEAAVAAYQAGYIPDQPHSTLAYNLGTTHHHLGQLPEAILWYRRAGELADPWLEENLWLARRSLGSRPLPPTGVLGFLASRGDLVRWCAVGLAWLAVALLGAASRLSVRTLVVAFLFSAGVYGMAFAAERWGPRPAVFMAACQQEDADLPAGSEAWVRATDDDRYQIVGLPMTCPSSAVALVEPGP